MEAEALQRLHHVSTARGDGIDTATVLCRAQTLLGGELMLVRDRVRELAGTHPAPASSSALHLVEGGGKAVRPLLTLLAARAVGGDPTAAVPHAVAAELVHSATLLHDDVIDDGRTRRGRPTSRTIWGNTISVLSGDLLFVQALQLVERAGPPGVLRDLMHTVSMLVQGEVLQFEGQGRFAADLQRYEDIVERKTASLFLWCARAGGVAGGGGDDEIEALGRYGRHVGRAFQIRDDVLDLTGDAAALGKGLAQDLAEGKLTLPAIHAVRRRPSLRTQLEGLARDGAGADGAALAAVVEGIRGAGGLTRAREQIDRELTGAVEALAPLPDGPATEVLRLVAAALTVREH